MATLVEQKIKTELLQQFSNHIKALKVIQERIDLLIEKSSDEDEKERLHLRKEQIEKEIGSKDEAGSIYWKIEVILDETHLHLIK